MKKRIFLAILCTSIGVLIVASLGVLMMLYKTYSDIHFMELASQTDLIASMVEQTGDTYLKVMDDPSYRLSWIAPDGDVLYDSSGQEESLANHLHRTEILQAKENGVGQSVRYSSTLAKETFNIAQKLKDGSFIRISVTMSSVYGLLMEVLLPFLLLFLGILLISLVLAEKLSHSIVKPILAIDLDHPMDTKAYPQIMPLLERIEASNQQIARQMEELQTKSREFESVSNNMDEGLILLSSHKSLLSCNDAARHLFEIQENWDVMQTAPFPEALQKADRMGRTHFDLHQNGRDYIVEVSVITEEQEKKGYLILILDTTEKVAARKRRQEFTANVTHELKTPIQTIMASTELLQAGLVKKEDEQRFLKYISRESSRLVDMINDIISLSRLDANNIEPAEEVDLTLLVEDIADSIEGGCAAANISLHLDLEEVCVISSKKNWQDICRNLLENAMKYNKEGGSIEVHLYLDSQRSPAQIVLEVQDTGIGIPKKYQDRVFERFFRVDKSHSKTVGGSGLGLAIVSHAAAAMDGSVQLESEPGAGTTVTVRIPEQSTERSIYEADQGDLSETDQYA